MSDDKVAVSTNGVELAAIERKPMDTASENVAEKTIEPAAEGMWLFSGMVADVKRRILSPNYLLDWQLVDKSHLEDNPNAFTPTPQASALKILAATLYIFISQVLPALTFALLLSERTNNIMGAAEVLLAMAIGGTIFALLAGQPLVVVGVTGPIVILVAGIYDVSESAGFDFRVTFFWTCFWSMLFHFVIAATNLCDEFPKYVTEFSGEMFGFLISMIYLYEGIYEFVKMFRDEGSEATFAFMLGMGTLWLCTLLSTAKSWSIFNPFVRELLCDYGPIISVITCTVFQYVDTFHDVHVVQLVSDDVFNVSDQPNYWLGKDIFDNMSNLDLSKSTGGSVMLGFAMGIIVTLLLWFDHNISALLSHRKQMKRGLSFNWDFFLLGLAIGICGVLGIPPNYGLLPQAPLHVRALATIKQEKQADDTVKEHWEYIAETRWSSLGQSLMFFVTLAPPVFALVAVIPTGVLAGMFIFLAIEGWKGNSLFERGIELLVCKSQDVRDEEEAAAATATAGSAEPDHNLSLDDLQLNADGHAPVAQEDAYGPDGEYEPASTNFTSAHAELHGHTWKKDVPIHITRNYTLIQLVLVTVIFITIFTDATVAFPLFICALIPLRYTIKKYAFSEDPGSPPAGAGAGADEAESGAAGADKQAIAPTPSAIDTFFTKTYQFLFSTKDMSVLDRRRYLEILDPLVKN